MRESRLHAWYLAHEAAILGVVGFVGFAVLWQVASQTGLVKPFFISRPTWLVSAAADLLRRGELASDLFISAREFAISFAIAVAVGLPLGCLMGWYRLFEFALDPYVWFLYSAPVVAFYPLFIFWLGVGTPTIVAISFLLTVFPITVNTLTGVQNVDQSLVRAARSFGAGSLAIFTKIALPDALPIVVAGLRLGVGRALVGVVVGEFFGANAGLGYRIMFYGSKLRTNEMFVFLVTVGLAGVLLTQVLRVAENYVGRWRA